MKTDLATSIFAAIIGVVAAYFICNIFLPPIENFTFSTLGSGGNYTLTEPDDDVFNFRALNPTVEVYVGECSEYNEYGECLDDIQTSTPEENPEPETTPPESEEQTENPSGEN